MVLTSGGVEPVLDSAGAGTRPSLRPSWGSCASNVGVMPGQELFGHLRLRVAAVADRVQMRQVPEYAPIKFAGHESGDFVFVRKNYTTPGPRRVLPDGLFDRGPALCDNPSPRLMVLSRRTNAP